jgi:hypothetical protein
VAAVEAGQSAALRRANALLVYIAQIAWIGVGRSWRSIMAQEPLGMDLYRIES